MIKKLLKISLVICFTNSLYSWSFKDLLPSFLKSKKTSSSAKTSTKAPDTTSTIASAKSYTATENQASPITYKSEMDLSSLQDDINTMHDALESAGIKTGLLKNQATLEELISTAKEPIYNEGLEKTLILLRLSLNKADEDEYRKYIEFKNNLKNLAAQIKSASQQKELQASKTSLAIKANASAQENAKASVQKTYAQQRGVASFNPKNQATRSQGSTSKGYRPGSY